MHNKVAIVTGASRGIGKAVAQELLREGVRVALFARNHQTLTEVATRYPTSTLVVAGDVTQEEDLQRLIEETMQRFGKIDLVVPCAGVATMASSGKATQEEIARHFAVNFYGAISTVSHCVPHLLPGSSIIYLTTSMTQGGFAGLAPYVASKDALQGWMRCQAVELAGNGIRVNAIAPGPTQTELWSRIGLSEKALRQVGAQITRRLLPGRFGTPEEVASLVVALAQAQNVYGQEWIADGGYSIT